MVIEWLVVAYLALIVCMVLFQRRLMYYPVKAIAEPTTYGLKNIEEVFIHSSDGVQLQTWVNKAKDGYPTIVYFHGNAFHLGERASKFSSFCDAGFGLIAVSYRGFGKSTGRPSEMGIYSDARASVEYALSKRNLPLGGLIYYGESLGTGVAVQMASERHPALLVLEAAYTSVETRSAELYPFVIGVRRLVRDKYDSLSKIKNVSAPLLMLHGEKDPTIPLRHGQTLFAAANEPKSIVTYPDVHHTDYSGEQIIAPLIEAAKKCGLIQS
jgi:fermentation-respiration switch protein FrsA (DUF1100 family)